MKPILIVFALLPILACGDDSVGPDSGLRLDAAANPDAERGGDAGPVDDVGPGTDAAIGTDGGPGDAGALDGGGIDCDSCDDDVACTVDSCDETTGTCVNTPSTAVCTPNEVCDGILGCVTRSCSMHSDCSDGSVCSGVETCDPGNVEADAAGCVAGSPLDCDDGIACTMDSCRDASGGCVHQGTDTDMDGFVAMGCLAGDDCNDDDPAVHPRTPDVCDGVDNDCSGAADDAPGLSCALGSGPVDCTTACGTPGTQSCSATCSLRSCVGSEVCNGCDDDANGIIDDGIVCSSVNGTCSTAFDMTRGGTVSSTTCGADNALDLSCSPAGTPDVFFFVTTGASGGRYDVSVPPGFLVQFVPTVCSGDGGCHGRGGSLSISGAATWHMAVERSDGTCGPFTLTVVRR